MPRMFYHKPQPSYIRNLRLPITNTQQTSFDQVTANFNIKKGVFHNRDLKLLSPTLIAHGKGSIDINDNSINYRLKVSGLHTTASHSQKSWFVPIQVTGTLGAPTFLPDFSALAEHMIEQKIKEHIPKNVTKHLDSIGNTVGETLKKLFP